MCRYQELTAIEVAPLSFVGVVVYGELEFTLRAGEASTSRVLHPHVDPNVLRGEIDSTDLPRCGKAQYLTVELGVVHGLNHARDRPIHL